MPLRLKSVRNHLFGFGLDIFAYLFFGNSAATDAAAEPELRCQAAKQRAVCDNTWLTLTPKGQTD